MRDQLDEKLRRFEELEKLLSDPDVLADSARMSAVYREHGSLSKLVLKYRRFRELNTQIREAMEMAAAADPEMRELAEAELPGLKDGAGAALERSLGPDRRRRGRRPLPLRDGDPRRHRRRGGGPVRPRPLRDVQALRRGPPLEGGSARHELHRAGRFQELILGLEGEGVYRQLQYESGGHRVQRVPETEAKGRIHTSAATVAVMAEPEDVEIDLKPDDYRKDIFHASGPGGQHVNKTASAIRLTHYASGHGGPVPGREEPAQEPGQGPAGAEDPALRGEAGRRARQAGDERKTKIGSGDRSQRIRTYNFPENRLTDHRINLTLYKLDSILAGNLAPVIDALIGIRAAGAAGRLRHHRISDKPQVLEPRPTTGTWAACCNGPPTTSASTAPTAPGLDAELLLAQALGCKRIELYTAFDALPGDQPRAAFRELVRRRAEGAPWPTSSATASSIRSPSASLPRC